MLPTHFYSNAPDYYQSNEKEKTRTDTDEPIKDSLSTPFIQGQRPSKKLKISSLVQESLTHLKELAPLETDTSLFLKEISQTLDNNQLFEFEYKSALATHFLNRAQTTQFSSFKIELDSGTILSIPLSILATESNYFKGIFSNNIREKHEQFLRLPHIEEWEVEILIEHCLHIAFPPTLFRKDNQDKIFSLLRQADYLTMGQLCNRILDEICKEDLFCFEDCEELLKHAKTYQNSFVTSTITSFLARIEQTDSPISPQDYLKRFKLAKEWELHYALELIYPKIFAHAQKENLIEIDLKYLTSEGLEIVEFLRKEGRYFTEYSAPKSITKKSLSFLSTYCPNLKYLDLSKWSRMSNKKFHYLIQTNKNLQALTFPTYLPSFDRGAVISSSECQLCDGMCCHYILEEEYYKEALQVLKLSHIKELYFKNSCSANDRSAYIVESLAQSTSLKLIQFESDSHHFPASYSEYISYKFRSEIKEFLIQEKLELQVRWKHNGKFLE